MITAMFLLSLSMIIPKHTYADEPDNSNLARGAAIWAKRCDNCHNMRSPSEFSAEQWHTIVQQMRLHAGLSGQQARDVYSFLAAQSQNTTVTTPTFALASTSTNENNIDIDLGKKIYDGTCIACHGPDGKGAIPGTPNMNGKDSPLANNSEALLLQRIKNGYHDAHSSIAMPAKGGNPNLTDEDLKAVLHYMKNTF